MGNSLAQLVPMMCLLKLGAEAHQDKHRPAVWPLRVPCLLHALGALRTCNVDYAFLRTIDKSSASFLGDLVHERVIHGVSGDSPRTCSVAACLFRLAYPCT